MTRSPLSFNAFGARACGLALLAICCLPLGAAFAQSPAAPPGGAVAAKPASAPVVATAKPAARASAAASAAKPAISGLTWSELTPPQQQALKPLQASWGTLTEAHKRKWLAMSQNYPKMPPEEQAKLHSRMTGWAALSPRQRTEARLNFAEVRQHSPDEKKAKWEAYQALSAEEKQKLAAGAKPKPQGAAPAIKPVPAQKLAVVPLAQPHQKQHPAIGGIAGKLDHNTLLPQAGAAAAASAPANH